MGYTDIRKDLILNKLTKAKYEELLANGQISDTELYYITDDNNRFYTKEETTQLIQDSVIVIEANPEVEESTAKLTSIKIGPTKYIISSGEEAGGDSDFSLSGTEVATTYSMRRNAGTTYSLESIQIGTDTWVIPQQEADLSDYYTKTQIDKSLGDINKILSSLVDVEDESTVYAIAEDGSQIYIVAMADDGSVINIDYTEV